MLLHTSGRASFPLQLEFRDVRVTTDALVGSAGISTVGSIPLRVLKVRHTLRTDRLVPGCLGGTLLLRRLQSLMQHPHASSWPHPHSCTLPHLLLLPLTNWQALVGWGGQQLQEIRVLGRHGGPLSGILKPVSGQSRHAVPAQPVFPCAPPHHDCLS